MTRRFVQVELDPEELEELELIRKDLGIRSYSETIRYLIRKEAKRLRERNVTPVTSEVEG
jgi:metal-responsive CopG/Arc/MetJ family transcriptional regulator